MTPIQIRDTITRYGYITRLLHWLIAALILWQLAGMGLKLVLGRDSIAGFFVRLHQPVGTALMVLIVLRAIWAFANRRTRPVHGNGLMGLAARAGHLALYAVMLLVPALALLRAWGSARPFAPFGREIFSAKEPPVEWAVTLGDRLHGEFGWLLALLIAGHILMVFVHDRIWRDQTLSRMAGR